MTRATTVINGTVVTMNTERAVIGDGAVAVDGDSIVDVGARDDVTRRHPDAVVVGTPGDLVVPGYVNAHQHLTGDRLIQSAIPDDLAPGEAIFSWVVPVHGEHRPEDDLLTSTLTLVESVCNGITTTVEAGTVAHPTHVAEGARRVGARITLGTWGWDIEEGPFTGSVDEVIARQRDVLDADNGPLVTPWVTLVGHDLMSDELVQAASALARDAGTGLTFHLSPSTSDPEQYLAKTGRRPVEHMADLGVLGPELLIAHGVHLDDSEVSLIVDSATAVAACPWAYLRLGQGTTQSFRHLDLWKRGGRLALGCDAENAGDAVDGLRTAAVFTGLAKDVPMDPTAFGAPDALELLTIKGAEAIGMADRIGSLEVGKQADIVVHDRTGPAWPPVADDVVQQLVWGTDGRSVRDVWIAGEQIVAEGRPTRVDLAALAAEAQAASASIMQRSGVRPAPRWPQT
ncbi:MAG: amidohydrolase family protein [Actinomycetota bacterium]